MKLGWMVDTLGRQDAELLVLAPHLSGLSAEVADLVGPLPIGGANATLLEVLADARPSVGPPVYAGIFAVDPFLSGAALFEALVRHRAAGVINLPTVGLARGEFSRALHEAGCDYTRELEVLSSARGFGLDVIALVFSYDQGALARSLGIETLLLHPGLPSSDEAMRARLAEGVGAVIDRLRADAAPPARVLLYRHPAFGVLLDGPERRADGVVGWDMECQSMPKRRILL